MNLINEIPHIELQFIKKYYRQNYNENCCHSRIEFSFYFSFFINILISLNIVCFSVQVHVHLLCHSCGISSFYCVGI